MRRPASIPSLGDHPDADALQKHDHPRETLKFWRGVLTAKAWGARHQLACFFADAEHGTDRIVLIFKPHGCYQAAFGSEDMREAPIRSVYELDIFVAPSCEPIIDRVERVRKFT